MPAQRCSTCRRAVNISTPRWESTACASTTSPTSITKISRSAWSHRRSRRWDSASTCPPSTRWRVATPTTLGVDPLRSHRKENEEQSIHLMYGFLYVADKYEGLVIVGNPDLKSKSPGVGTLLDGNPANNFLKRALAFNPGGILNGARRITIAGTYAYILCERGLVVVDLGNPLQPKVTAEIGSPFLNDPRGVAVQFRYAFVVDREGLKVLDVTHLAQPKPVPGAVVALQDARNLYVARTYAYVASGKEGMAIVDVEHPEQPRLLSDVQRRRRNQRCQRRQAGYGEFEPIRLCSGRTKWFAGCAAILAARQPGVRWLQPSAHAEADCDLSNAWSRAGCL